MLILHWLHNNLHRRDYPAEPLKVWVDRQTDQHKLSSAEEYVADFRERIYRIKQHPFSPHIHPPTPVPPWMMTTPLECYYYKQNCHK